MQLITEDKINLDDLIFQLEQGKTIVYPTETCYGLGCDATNQQAVDKIFEIKKRQKDKPVLVVVPNISLAMEYIVWNRKIDELAQKHWPGPLTIVASVQSDNDLAKGVVAENGTVAFRVTEHPLSAKISEKLNKPLVSTSANISSMTSPYEVESIIKMFNEFENKPDIVIDGGELPHKSPSTVVRVVDGKVEVLRQGEIVV